MTVKKNKWSSRSFWFTSVLVVCLAFALSTPPSRPVPSPLAAAAGAASAAEPEAEPAPEPTPEPVPEAKPEPAPEAKPEPAPEPTPEDDSPDFARLGDPDMARKIGLARDQRDQIADLLKQRAQALADASDDERAAITEANNKKLLAVLTDVQRGDFLGKPVEKRLRFMFRYQQWKDVLQWLAEHAEMSLVMDAPPPGTFNYSDTREYTPEEAIDMLNGVLIVRGYTLVRRGRMLMLLDLSEGLPSGVVFEAPLESLDRFGKFEFVTVQFDLGKRSPEAVESAITPLLTPYHKIVTVPATRQVFVTDRAGVMQAVHKVIQALPEPVTPPPPPTPATPEYPVVEVYPITKADPDAAMTVLKALVPTGNIVLDPKLKQINAHATPSQQAMIQRVLERMEAGIPEEARPVLEVHPVGAVPQDVAAEAQLIETLKNIVPQAQVSWNADRQSLIAWASAADQATIREALEKLNLDDLPRVAQQLEVHRLHRVDPTTTLTLFQSILPDARLAVDQQTRTLIAVAVPADQEVIRGTLKILEPAEPSPDTPELRYYELTLAMPPDLPEAIQKVSPGSIVALDQSGMRLMVIASPSEHTKIDKTIQTMQRTTFVEGRPQLASYELTREQRRRFDAVWPALSKELPRVEIMPTQAETMLAIWARPRQHEMIAEIIEELKTAVPDAERLKLATYPIAAGSLPSILSMLETLYPETKFVADTDAQRLMVWSSQEQHDLIKESLETLQATEAAAAATVEIYPLTKADPTSALTMLQKLLPDAQLTLDAKTNSLIALAVPADQQVIRSTLEQLQAAATALDTPVLRFHPLSREPSEDLIKILKDLVPKVEITSDAENQRLTVVATPDDHDRIQSVIEQFEGSTPPVERPTLRIYPGTKAQQQRLTAVLTQLTTQMPSVQVLPDASRDELAIWAKPTDHARIAEMLEQMGADSTAEDSPRLAAYALKAAEPSAVTEMLKWLFPNVEAVVDENTRRVMVWAPPVEQARISEAIQQIDEGEPGGRRQEVRAYPLRGHDPAVVIEMLTQPLPKTRFSSDPQTGTILAWGTLQDHEQIAKLVEQLTQGRDSTQRAVVYDLKAITASSAREILQNAVPQAKLTLDTENPRRLTAWARTFEHESIKAILADLDVPDDRRREATIEVYNIPAVSIKATSYQIQTLATAFPEARFSPGAEPGQIVAWASAEDHQQIRQLVARMKTPEADQTPTLTVYPLKALDAEQAITLLQSIVPDAKLTVDPNDPHRLTAWAKPADHQNIENALQQVDVPDGPGNQTARLRFYRLEEPAPANLLSVLQDLAPRTRITLDEKNQQLAVIATDTDHDLISTTLDQFHQVANAKDKPALTVYPFRASDPAGVLAMLKELYPGRQLLLDEKKDRLLVWASSEDQASIKQSLDQLLGATATEFTPRLEVYRLTRADPEATLAILQKLLPDAQLTLDAKNNLIALAIAADQQVIRTMIEQLQTAVAAPDTPDLRFHPLSQMPADNLIKILQEMVPQAQITADVENERLTVVATPEDHGTIEKVVAEFEASTPPVERATLSIYPATPAQQRRFEMALAKLSDDLPSVQVLPNAAPGELAIWATPTEHAQVAELLKRLAGHATADDPLRLAGYTLRAADPDTVSGLLTRLFPDADIVIDEKTRKVMVWATLAEQAKISEAIQQIDSGEPGDWQPELRVYPLRDADPTVVVQMLTQTLPEMRFSSDPRAGTLLAWGTRQDHQQIQKLVEQLTQAPDTAMRAAVYDLKTITAATAQSLLQTAVPQAKLTTDPESPQRLTAWARAFEHDSISAIIQEIDVPGDARQESTVEVYSIPSVSLTGSLHQLRTLSTAFPKAQFSLGGDAGQVVAWASPEDHEQIKALVARMKTPAAEDTPSLTVYTLEHIEADQALEVLRKIVADAELTADPANPKRLTAWAKPAEHQTIQEALAQIDGEEAAGSDATAVIYTLEGMSTRAIHFAGTFLASVVPQARFTPGSEEGQMVVWATAKDHQQIERLIEQMTRAPSPDIARRVAVYSLQHITATSATQVLSAALPRATLTTTPDDPQRLTAWASPADQATIKTILDQIDIEGEVGGSTAEVYQLEGDLTAAAAAAALRLLGTAFPNARFSTGADPGQIVAWASAREHGEINDLIQRLNAGPPPDKAPNVAVYSLEFIEAARAESVLRTAVPKASLTLDPMAPQRLTVWATPNDHQAVQEVLAQIDVQEAADADITVTIYSLREMSPASVTHVWRFLSNAVPNARLTPGAEPDQLVAWASARDHRQLEILIEQLTTVAPEDEPKAAIYTTQFVTAANATKTLRLAVPRATLTPDDDDPQRFTAWARPADHGNIQAILEQIDIEGEPDGSGVEVYQLEGAVPAMSALHALRLLNTAFPRALFSMGTEPGQLVAWASVQDHAQIDKLIERLNVGPPPDKAPAVVVYALEFVEADQARTVLQSAVPNARLTLDPGAPRRLTAWATPLDHRAIESVLAQIDVEEATQSDLTVVIYSLGDMDSRGAIGAWRFLAGAVPNARLTPGIEPDQIVAWASPKDHEQLRMLVEQLTTVAPEDETKIAVYTTQFISAANASKVLAAAVPRATVTPDADDPQRLTVWARATDHDSIWAILQEIDLEGDAETAATVEIYALQGQMTAATSMHALRLLGAAFPRARVSMGTDPGQIVAWATPRDHQEIRALVDRVNAGLPDEVAPKAEIYALEFLPAANAVTLLQRAVPGAVLTPDPRDPQRLTAWATPLEHRSITEVLQQLDVETDPASAPMLHVYTLEGVDAAAATAALRVLSSAFPGITFTPGSETGQVLALAGSKQHEEIQKLVDQLNQPAPEELAARAVVYSLKFITAATARQTLQTALPQVRLTVDQDEPQRFTAWARPADQDKIARILQEIDIEADPDSRPTPVVYTLEAIDPHLVIHTIRYLSSAFPQAIISTGAARGQLIVFATPRDHEQMKKLVEQVNQGPPPELAPTAKVYPLKLASPTAAVQALSRAVPDATLSVAPDSNQIVAWARPADHEKISEILRTLDQKGPADLEPKAVVYTIEAADATEVSRILRSAVPQARLTAGADPQQLIAWARPADHELIEEIIAMMGETGPEERASRVVVYTIPSGDSTTALTFLQSTVPAARFSIGSDPRRLIAWARPADHERIKRAVEEITEGAGEVQTRVYRFRYADPTAALSVLGALVPTAKMAVDRNEQTLVVSAIPEDHDRVRAAVEAMDGEDGEGQRPSLKVHRIEVGDVASVFRSLFTLFRNDPSVQLSLDTRNDSLIAIATQAKHERITEIIQAVAEASLQDSDMAMELYPTRNIDSTAAMRILQQMLDRQGARAEISYDFRTNQLIAIARPEHQQLILETLDQLRGEEPLLEIYELQFVDPMSAQLAIDRQFADEGLYGGPEVDTDPVTDQLFVRATSEQHQTIRELLIKMGETRLKLINGRDGRAMRTLRVQGNVADALQEIQRLWPRLRENELRIISPETPLPVKTPPQPKTPSPPPKPAEPPKEEVPPAKPAEPPKEEVPPAKPAEPPKDEIPPKGSSEDDEKAEDDEHEGEKTEGQEPAPDSTGWLDRWERQTGFHFVAQIGSTAQPPGEPPAADPGKKDPAAPVEATAATPEATATPDDEPAPKPATIFLVPGDGTITIVSEDSEAVQQLEELLRTLLPGSGEIGRNISMFPLKYSSAVDVADRLRELFMTAETTWRRGQLPISIVPDERLNAIIVQASRIDRETIEALIRTLDTEDALATKPQIIPIHYAEAREVAATLREVFRSQMAGRTATTTPTPGATRIGSRMTTEIAVDEGTNSLIILAASPLLEEIIELANVLDRGARENPARGVKIISLQKTNSARVEQALQRILGTRPTTRPTPRPSR